MTDYAADKSGRSDKALYRRCLLPNIDFYLDINLSLGMESPKEKKQRVKAVNECISSLEIKHDEQRNKLR